MERSKVRRATFRNGFVLFLVLAVSMLFLAVAWPFLKPLLLGAMLAGLSRPLYRWVTRLLRGRASLAAVLTLLILVRARRRAFECLYRCGRATGDQLSVTMPFPGCATSRVGRPSMRMTGWCGVSVAGALHSATGTDRRRRRQGRQSLGRISGRGATQITASTAAFLLNLFVMLYAMFFFFRDGRLILEKIFYYMPLESTDDESRLLERLIR